MAAARGQGPQDEGLPRRAESEGPRALLAARGGGQTPRLRHRHGQIHRVLRGRARGATSTRPAERPRPLPWRGRHSQLPSDWRTDQATPLCPQGCAPGSHRAWAPGHRRMFPLFIPLHLLLLAPASSGLPAGAPGDSRPPPPAPAKQRPVGSQQRRAPRAIGHPGTVLVLKEGGEIPLRSAGGHRAPATCSLAPPRPCGDSAPGRRGLCRLLPTLALRGRQDRFWRRAPGRGRVREVVARAPAAGGGGREAI